MEDSIFWGAIIRGLFVYFLLISTFFFLISNNPTSDKPHWPGYHHCAKLTSTFLMNK